MNGLADSQQRWRWRVLLPVTAALFGLLGVWVALVPAEARLGNLVKLVFVHGALAWVGLAAFTAAGALALPALVTRRRGWFRAAAKAGLTALLLWTAYSLSAMVVTGLTWGQVVAWNEPRVRVTAFLLVAAVAIEAVIRLVDHRDFSAAVRVVMGIAPWVVVRRAEVIRHPVDPIGGSGSPAMQTFFALIVLTVAGLAVSLFLWLWTGRDPGKAEST
jgi:hypothetical protein